MTRPAVSQHLKVLKGLAWSSCAVKERGTCTQSIQRARREVAWRVFTEKMGTWWPLAHYKIGKFDAVDAIIEPRVGGRWYERGKDGSTCDWGRVLVWEPHSRLVVSWDISADWQP